MGENRFPVTDTAVAVVFDLRPLVLRVDVTQCLRKGTHYSLAEPLVADEWSQWVSGYPISLPELAKSDSHIAEVAGSHTDYERSDSLS